MNRFVFVRLVIREVSAKQISMNVFLHRVNTEAFVRMKSTVTLVIVQTFGSKEFTAKTVKLNELRNDQNIRPSLFDLEIANPDEKNRLAAFWSVMSVVSVILLLLTLSDVPWHKIISRVSFLSRKFECCSSVENEEKMVRKAIAKSQMPDSTSYQGITKVSIGSGFAAKTVNCHVISTVWKPADGKSDKFDNLENVKSVTPVTRITTIDGLTEDDEKQTSRTSFQSMESSRPSEYDSFAWTRQIKETLRNQSTQDSSSNSTKPSN